LGAGTPSGNSLLPRHWHGEKAIRAEYTAGRIDQPLLGGPAETGLAGSLWSQEQAGRVLANEKSSSVDKLKAVESLYKAGTKQIQIADRVGMARTYTIERQRFSNHQSMVHLFAQDDDGKRRIVLRGVSNEDGTYRQERGNDGNYADYQGSWWTEHMAMRTAIVRPNSTSVDVRPPRGHGPAHEQPQVVPQAGVEPRQEPMRHHLATTEQNEPPSPAVTAPQTYFLRPIDRRRFFAVQPDNISCGPTALAMAHSDFITGRPPRAREIEYLEQVTGTFENGRYPGGADLMAVHARRYGGLEAKAYNYGFNNGRVAMDYLDAELKKKHGAIIWMLNENTGNGHWGYVAGIDRRSGNYVLGDPGGMNTGIYKTHLSPVSREHLINLLNYRTGFAAVWKATT
jgi:hypothetical protein